MAQDLHITFKAGICDADEKDVTAGGAPRHIKPLPEPGYIYLFTEDDLLHFCWRPRSAPMSEPQLDLIMFAGDASFKPYQTHGSKKPASDSSSHKPTNGRLYVLFFSSSSDRHFFWLQSASQNSDDPAWHSPRDLKMADVVNKLLAGDEVDVRREMAGVATNGRRGGPSGDDDAAMEDGDEAGSPDHHRAASGGAGADATGGDVREEGEESREGGADGGRAAQADARAAVTSFLESLQSGSLGQPGPPQQQQQQQSKPFTTLPDLLPATTTLPVLEHLSSARLDRLLAHLPPTLILLAAGSSEGMDADPDPETLSAILLSLSADQKRALLARVLRSPQFAQSLASLTHALRDGGLPSVAEALHVPVRNGGYLQPGGNVPVGGGDAVEVFLEGVKVMAAEDREGEGEEDERMEE